MSSPTLTVRLLKKGLCFVGKTYEPDLNIPFNYVVGELLRRLSSFIRSFIFLRRFIFLGKNVDIRGLKYIKFGKFVTIEDYSLLDGYSCNGISLGNYVKVGRGTIIRCTAHMSVLGKGLSIGNNSSIGEYGYLGCAGGITVGDDVIMGQYVSFHAQEHVYADTSMSIRDQGVAQRGIVLGSNIWVGSKVTFLDGACVGDGSVVAAGTVVKGEFPPFSVIGGVPARIIKMRC